MNGMTLKKKGFFLILLGVISTTDANAKEPFVIKEAFNADPRCDATSVDCVFDIVMDKSHVKAVVVKSCSPRISGTLDNLMAGKGPVASHCNGVTHVYRGKIDLGDYAFDSDSKKPLTFKIDKDKGYTYLKGKGTVTMRGGKKISLP